MKWFSRRVVPNYGITYGKSNLDVDYTEYDDVQQNVPQQNHVDYFRVGFKYHPKWNEVYDREYAHAIDRYYKANGHYPRESYSQVWGTLGAIEAEAHSNAEQIIARLIDNGY
jgi:hypothetical protein